MSASVLHVNFAKVFRGAENQTVFLHQSLLDRGWRSYVLVRAGSEFEARAKEQSLPNVYTIRPKSPRIGEFDPGLAVGVADVAKKVGAEIVHAHSAHAAGVAFLAKRLYGCAAPLIFERAVTDPIGLFSRWKYNAASAVIAVCGAIREGLIARGVKAKKIRVIPIGLPLAVPVGCRQQEQAGKTDAAVKDPRLTIGTLCALDRTQKDVATLIRAYAKARDKIRPSRLVIFGDGRDRVRLEALAGELKLGSSVEFRGWWRGEPREAFRQMDIFVLSSLKEGASNVLVGAMAAGLPCIATRVGGNPEVLDEAGILVPAQEPAALAQAMVYVAGNEKLTEELSRQAKLRSQNFDLKIMVEATIQCYWEVLGRAEEAVA